MKKINRDDMLELTRRMTPTRHCFTRVAGAYMSSGGEIDDTFNVMFRNLRIKDLKTQLAVAKTVPFSKTNEQLKEYMFSKESVGPGTFWQLLKGIHSCKLENDLLLEVLYEEIGSLYKSPVDYVISVFHGTYDIPCKTSDNQYLEDSVEIYDFIIVTVAPLLGNYEQGKPEFGFLFPAFSDRSSWDRAIDIYEIDERRDNEVLRSHILGRKQKGCPDIRTD